MKRFIQTINETLAGGEDLILATIVAAPDQTRLSGVKMLIWAEGRTLGTIGGGLLEAEVLQVASRIFTAKTSQAHLLKFSGDASPNANNVPCGKGTAVLIEHIAATPDNRELFEKLLKSLKKGIRCYALTHIGTNHGILPPLQRQLVSEENPLPEGPAKRYPRISALLKNSEIITVPVMEFLNGAYLFLNPWIVPSTIFLFGAGHVAQELAELAGRAGFRTVVLDDREKFATPKKFPTADNIIVLESFENAFHDLEVDGECHVIIVTGSGQLQEKTLLKQALSTPAGYIGIIGSTRKRNALFKELSSEGFCDDDLLRIHCPIGIHIQAESPLEIAVSIIAQLIHLRAERKAEKRLEADLPRGKNAAAELPPLP